MAHPLAVDVQGVSKRFRLFHERSRSLRDRLLRTGPAPYEDLWAVNDVSFEVLEGETVGILGRNGSGKSTLLKCICGVLQPTSGQVVQRGSLAGLLELGAGFQQELSGRENVFLNGSLLGLSRRDMEQRFDEIVAFAELEQFIDNQVKFYSSGMYVRLGFAVAVCIEPEILVIDEVLAVGDERFQRKCLERIRQFQEEGRTIILVSHAPDQVRAICDRALVMHNGTMVDISSPGEAVRLFREHVLEAEDQAAAAPGADGDGVDAEALALDLVPGGQHVPVRLDQVRVLPSGSGQRHLRSGEPFTVRIAYWSAQPLTDLGLVLEIRDMGGGLVHRTDAGTSSAPLHVAAGAGVVDLVVDRFPMLDGAFVVSIGASTEGQVAAWAEDACRIEVVNPGRDSGVVALHLRASILPGGPEGAAAPAHG